MFAMPSPDALRPRERALLFGPETLSDVDLLALLIGTGAEGESARRIAAALCEPQSGRTCFGRWSPHELAACRGIGPAKAARILAGLELGRRAALDALRPSHPLLTCFDAVVAWARPRLAALDHEEVWSLSLDARNGLKTARRIAQGGLHGCALTPRDILTPALRDSASAIVLVHNHPSGDPTPSGEDVAMTRAVAAACQVVGLDLVDHVVVARGGAASLAEHGGL